MSYTSIPGQIVAAGRFPATGTGFVTSSEPFGFAAAASQLGPTSSVYPCVLATNNQIDVTNAVPLATPGTVARSTTSIQTSDTNINVTGSDLAVPAAADTIFTLVHVRTATGT